MIGSHGQPHSGFGIHQGYTLAMRPSEALHLYRSRSREIALSHHISDVRVFGSALRGEGNARSALDLLVEPTALAALMDIGAIRFKLKTLLGIEVDVRTPNRLPPSFFAQRCNGFMRKIVKAIDTIQTYTLGVDATAFIADGKT